MAIMVCSVSTLAVVTVFLILTIVQGQGGYSSRKRFLETLFTEKMFEIPPKYDSPDPVEIESDLYVNSLDSVNEANMEFTVGVMLHLKWEDVRLNSRFQDYDFEYIELDSHNMANFWTPDIYFPNEKRASFHNVMTKNRMIRLHRNNSVSFTIRLSLTLSCPMDLRRYPFDKQSCNITIESFGYTQDQLKLRWSNETDEAVKVKKDLELPQFRLRGTTYHNKHRFHRFRGNYSALQATFYMVRNINYYVIQMYVPTLLIVMLSWVSFWLNVNSVPGRVNLGVLSVLTISTQSSSVNRSLPRVSYTKAIDIWMATCLVFVVAALVEFAIANVISRKGSGKGTFFKRIFKIPKDKNENKAMSKENSRSTLEGMCEGVRQRDKSEKDTILTVDGTRIQNVYPGVMDDDEQKKKERRNNGSLYALYLDVASRVLFPLAFGVFNVVYWIYYLNLMIY